VTVTKPRHLAAVPDKPPTATRLRPAAPATAQNPDVLDRRDAAHAALTALDVRQEILDAAERAARELGESGASPTVILLGLAQRMFTLGYLDGAGDRDAAGRKLAAEETVLAKVVRLETRERAELPARERAPRAVRP
jgi:hypothetical protein